MLVTGQGFPPLAVRACVHRLAEALRLPVLGLVDCNPFGAIGVFLIDQNVSPSGATHCDSARRDPYAVGGSDQRLLPSIGPAHHVGGRKRCCSCRSAC